MPIPSDPDRSSVAVTWVFRLYFLLSATASAQTIPGFHYSVEEGLPASMVYESLQDSRGFIWLATEFGVSRFDGKIFRNYTIRDGLHVNDVWGLFEDSRQRIWIKSFSPHLLYIHHDSIHRIQAPHSLEGSTIKDISEDAAGNCWFSHDRGMLCLKNDGALIDIPNDSNYARFSWGYLRDMEDGSWFLLNWKIFRTTGKTQAWPVPLSRKYLLAGRPVYAGDSTWLFFSNACIVRYELHTGRKKVFELDSLLGIPEGVDLLGLMDNHETTDDFWLLTNKGIFVLDPDLRLRPEYHHLRHKPFKHVMKDREGNLWFATGGDGLYCYPATALAMNMLNYSFGNRAEGEKIATLCSDGAGHWFAGAENGVLYRFGGSTITSHKTGMHKAVNSLHYIDDKRLMAIGSHSGVLWVSLDTFGKILPGEGIADSVRGLSSAFDPAPVSFHTLTLKNSFYDRDSSALLIAAREGVFRWKLGEQPVLIDKGRAYAVCRDTRGRVWVGRPNGISWIENGQVRSPVQGNPLLSVSVFDLLWERDGVLWVATDGYGLFGYRPETGALYLVTEMQNEIVKDITMDTSGRIWAATNQGIRCISIVSHEPFSYTFRSLTKREGLISNEVNRVYAEADRILVATNRGVSVLHPFPWPEDTLSPEIHLDGVRVGNTHRSLRSGRIFHYDDNDISIYYSSPAFRQRENIRYSYRLLGQSPEWIATASEWVTFHNLAPGDYRFQVKAMTTDGKMSPGSKEWVFSIEPHWTQTAFFKWMIAALTIAVIAALVIWRFRVERQQHRFQAEISALQARALQAQMNPHFVFNALNAIQSLMGSNNTDEASEYLALFARLIRMNLELSGQQWVSLEREMKCLQTYLELEQMRFGDRLSYEVELDDDIRPEQTMIPPLLLHPFVENALLHGILPLEDRKGKVGIHVSRQQDTLHIRVMDNGIGLEAGREFRKPGHVSHGVALIEKRLKLLFGTPRDGAWVTLGDRPDGKPGTCVDIYLPSVPDPMKRPD